MQNINLRNKSNKQFLVQNKIGAMKKIIISDFFFKIEIFFGFLF